MRTLLIAFALILSFGAPVARANTCVTTEPVEVGQGYFKGHHLREMNDLELGTYAMGYIDALFGGNIFGMNRACVPAIEACTQGRSGHQLAAIVRKYLKESPENWHYPAHGILFNAVLRQCLLSKEQ